jgi:hypothetical protein
VCSLPQRPGALTVIPRASTVVGDAGTSDLPPYVLTAVLPGDRTTPAKLVTLDPRPFLRGAPRRGPDGKPLDDDGVGPTIAPGSLAPCTFLSQVLLGDASNVPASFVPGPTWPDGVPYVDGGVDLTCDQPPKPARCGLPSCACASATAAADGGAPVDAGGALCEADAGTGTAASTPVPLPLPPLDPPQPVALARDAQVLYIADDSLPLVHVIDMSVPTAPHELLPYVLSSLADPTRAAPIRDVAISPPTRDFKRYLYAVDHREGTIAVFDATNPLTADRSPLRRPHAELNPFQPPDRLAFSAPVVAVAFGRNDFPLSRINGVKQVNAATGLLCNPNPNLDPITNPADKGVFYRANSTDPVSPLGPTRLRGVFAFATLTSGQIITIDVDDWDAPCRRPQELTGSQTAATGVALAAGSLAAPEPAPTGPDDHDPYHAPVAPPESVSQEVFFPVSAPHRIRSAFLLRDDTGSGKHIPFLPSTPSIQSTGAPLPLFGQGSEATPRLRPTAVTVGVATGTEDIGVRFSTEVPDVHLDQDWGVTYEGIVPGFDGLPAIVSSTDGFASAVLDQPQARFCAKGVEDWSVGGERANAVTNALAAAGRPPYPERLDRRMTDYVQVVDDLLPSDDPYWSVPNDPAPNSCWDPSLRTASDRYNVCSSIFGTAADQSTNRDFPILEAYDDHVKVGRFAKIPPNQSREVIFSDPSNAPFLKLLRCCFHHQVKFNVRAASEWVTVGSAIGMLSHVVPGAGGRCVPSCDPREALLNARAPSLPFGTGEFAPVRNSSLAMRNPMFSFFVQNGEKNNADSVPTRDTSWRFQTRGAFTPLLINLAATTNSVNPQSMRFIDTLGQIAVVDAASQGLVLIDLANVTIARAPYF